MFDRVQKEANLEAYLKERVEHLGGRCYKFTSPGNVGVSDRLIVLPNRPTAYLELKRLGESPEPLQQKFIRDMTKLGQRAGWTDSREGVDAFLEGVLDG